MVTVTLEEMQRDIFGYFHRVQAGETFIVIEAGLPVAEIKPPSHAELSASVQQRPFGLCTGDFHTPDDFDVPLPDDVRHDLTLATADAAILAYPGVKML